MNKLNKKRRQFIFISLLIPVTLLIAFVVFPAIDLFRMSFTDWDGFSADYHFINFENYISMFHNKDLWLSLRNNAVYFCEAHLCGGVPGRRIAFCFDLSISAAPWQHDDRCGFCNAPALFCGEIPVESAAYPLITVPFAVP